MQWRTGHAARKLPSLIYRWALTVESQYSRGHQVRLWFAPSSEVPIYRQLFTQIVLAILSGDLRPGDRLPSTRELARRFAIHPNTVSAGYRELEREGWTELRHGSGVYVCERRAPATAEARVDAFIGDFFRRAHELG